MRIELEPRQSQVIVFATVCLEFTSVKVAAVGWW